MRILGLGHILCSKPAAFFRTPEMSGRKLWDTSRHFLPMLIASATGVALSIGAGLLVSQWEDRVGVREFHAVAENQSGILQNGINQYLSRLVALRALFESSPSEVSRRQFDIFAEEILRDQTAIQSVSWIPRVPHAERAARERAAIEDGILKRNELSLNRFGIPKSARI
jgi:CHASE1-domain containing sensor protein